MKVRLGYVAISKSLEGITSSHTLNYTNYLKKEEKEQALKNIICSNLDHLETIIDYNIANQIHFYRLSSALIPLATHQDVLLDYIQPYQEIYQRIGKKIRDAKMRVDFHPGEYTILNSTRKEVVQNTVEILKYHNYLSKALEIERPLLVLHIGSNAFGKKASLTRFKHQVLTLPNEIRKSLALENDDKIFTVKDLLPLCEELKLPLILDYHHHLCNPTEEPLESFLPQIRNTWTDITPKMHFSSPKNKTKKEMRSHHDYIDYSSFLDFLTKIEPFFDEIDIMIEAKMKDDAMFRLLRQLKLKTTATFLDDTTFQTKKAL